MEGPASISSVCAYASVSLVEIPFTGEPQELSPALGSWAVNCGENLAGDKMEVEFQLLQCEEPGQDVSTVPSDSDI